MGCIDIYWYFAELVFQHVFITFIFIDIAIPWVNVILLGVFGTHLLYRTKREYEYIGIEIHVQLGVIERQCWCY